MNWIKKNSFPLLTGLCIGIAVALISAFATNDRDKEKDKEYLKLISDTYKIYALPLPETAVFAGETVPLEKWDIAEKFDRELLVNSYWHSNTLLAIKRSSRWFPVIEPILKDQGIPDDFKYLAMVESNFTHVSSPAGAVGFWQFLPETATQFGLEVNDEVDERYHVEKSTVAACKYFKDAYNKFGSWTMVAASYNMGMQGLKNQVDRQKQSSYYDLLLNEETSRYVFRILSMKEIVNHADQYGFVIRPADNYVSFDYSTVTVNTAIPDFATFAAEHNITYKDLKLYNPWLRQASLKNKLGKTYEIKIPRQ
jgi:membrane-bound lytic murein transglycosylase D